MTPERIATPLPSIWRGESPDYPDEKRWCLSFDVGPRMIEVELFDDGSCEWFSYDRGKNGSGVGNDREPFAKVCVDAGFKAAMEAVLVAYGDALANAAPTKEQPSRLVTKTCRKCDVTTHTTEECECVCYHGGSDGNCPYHDEALAKGQS